MRAAYAAALLLLLPSVTEAAGRTKVAVMELRALGFAPEQAELLSEVALAEVSAADHLEVVGKSDIASMIGFERQKQLMGCAEAACLAEIGGALGVDYVILGSLGRLGKLLRLDLKLIDSKKSRVLARAGENVSGGDDALIAAVQKLARTLTAKIPAASRPAAQARPAVGAGAKPPSPTDAAAASHAADPAETRAILAVAPAEAPAVATPRSAPAPESATQPLTSSRRASTWSWVALGTGGAMLAGAGTFALLASQSYQAQKDASAGGDLPGYEEAKSSTRTRAAVADGLLVGGVVAAGVGAVLLFTGGGETSGGQAAVSMGASTSGAGLLVTGRF